MFDVLTGEVFDSLVTEEDGFVGIGEIFLSGDDTAVSSIGLPSGGVWVLSGACQVASLVWGL